MFTSKDPDEKSGLEEAIDTVLSEMAGVTTDSDEYAKMVDQLVKLYSLKDTDAKKRVSPDTLAMITGNLLGILVIVGHERAHVVTSKALSFVTKLR
jgi:hypothetical protein